MTTNNDTSLTAISEKNDLQSLAAAISEENAIPSVVAFAKLLAAVELVLAIEDEEERNGILGLVSNNTGWRITLEPVNEAAESSDTA